MKGKARSFLALIAGCALVLAGFEARAEDAAIPWPPPLPGSKDGTVTLTSDLFLQVPPEVETRRKNKEAAPFVVARKPPTVEFAYHPHLGKDAVNRRLWSSWGDICVARDGKVYCGIGDHGKDAEGDARCFLYCWDPARKKLEQVVDMNRVVPPRKGQPAWSKIHARIEEGADGKIYFSCTLNAGSRAGQPQFHWNEQLPGGQLYQYDPATGKTEVCASLPPKRCTATALLDHERQIWWCNLEAGEGDALWGLDLKTKKVVYRSADGVVSFNRNFALARDGSIYFNGDKAIGRYNPATGKLASMRSSFGDSPGMRSSTRESRAGDIYGTTHRTNQLFRYNPAQDKLELLGPNWLEGDYTTVTVLSPDERFLYYLPGSHGRAFQTGTPVIQYNLATGQRKVLAFLAGAFEKACGYVPGGTYGVKLSGDGSTLYVNFNGHASDAIRPKHMKAIGFGLCGFAAIHIPASER
jgi:sugar lactone lactonase YvrE